MGVIPIVSAIIHHPDLGAQLHLFLQQIAPFQRFIPELTDVSHLPPGGQKYLPRANLTFEVSISTDLVSQWP